MIGGYPLPDTANMTEVLHGQLTDAIKKAASNALPGVFLVHGQEMLVEQAVESLVVKLLNGASRDLCCDTVEGLVEKIPDVLAQMNTFSMMAGCKVVIFKEAKLFEGRANQQRLAEQIIEAWDGEDLERAAKSLLDLCGQLSIEPEQVMEASPEIEPWRQLHEGLGDQGLDKVVQCTIDRGRRSTGGGNDMETLLTAVAKGFADRHHLIITVNAKVPKNLKLYKSIRDHGWIVDCNVPMGERRADRMAQEGVLRQALETILGPAGKHLQAGAFDSLCRLTGFDLRTFVQNVEKLIDFTGARTDITVEDVQGLLRRTKSDPIFELTNAVADRNLKQALFFLHSLLDGRLYPLQILSALANQIRKLLVAKSFVLSRQGKCWAAGMAYAQFKSGVMPAIAEFDRQIRDMSLGWRASADEAKDGKAGEPKTGHDIVLAPNANNPYPVYQTLLKSEKYTRQELLTAMALLSQADVRLKSSGQDAALVLNKAIMNICGARVS
jgi:DNA polymerase III subunit delta